MSKSQERRDWGIYAEASARLECFYGGRVSAEGSASYFFQREKPRGKLSGDFLPKRGGGVCFQGMETVYVSFECDFSNAGV